MLEALVNYGDELAGEDAEEPDLPVLRHGGEHIATRGQRHVQRLRLLLGKLVQVCLHLGLEATNARRALFQ